MKASITPTEQEGGFSDSEKQAAKGFLRKSFFEKLRSLLTKKETVAVLFRKK